MERRIFTDSEIKEMKFPNDGLPGWRIGRGEDWEPPSFESGWPYWSRCVCDSCGAEELGAVDHFGAYIPKAWRGVGREEVCEQCLAADASLRMGAVQTWVEAKAELDATWLRLAATPEDRETMERWIAKEAEHDRAEMEADLDWAVGGAAT